jgi:hypothetical protein
MEKHRGTARPESGAVPPVPPHTIPTNPTARAAHSLQALMELSQELSVSLDFYGVADMALFNLMGQLCTSKAALWIAPPDVNRPPVLLRSHGIRKQWVRAIGTASGLDLIRTAEMRRMPMFTQDLEPVIGPMGVRLSNQAGIALYVPICARDKLFALVALGHRLDGTPWTDLELQVLRASLSMIGVALTVTSVVCRPSVGGLHMTPMAQLSPGPSWRPVHVVLLSTRKFVTSLLTTESAPVGTLPTFRISNSCTTRSATRPHISVA